MTPEELKLKQYEAETARRDARAGRWFGLIKFLLGTFLVTVLVAYGNHQIQNAEVSLAQFRMYSEFMDRAVGGELEDRVRFTEYFAAVLPDKESRGLWKTYHDAVRADYDNVTKAEKDLKVAQKALAEANAKTAETAEEKAALQEKTDALQATISEKEAEIARLRAKPVAAARPAPRGRTREWIVRNKGNLYCADLRGSDISGVDLSGAKLIDAELGGADLHEANLRGTILNGACFIQATLIDADLSGAILNGTNLDQADLSRANLAEANLRGAYLRAVRFDGADLHEANLGEVIGYPWHFTNAYVHTIKNNPVFVARALEHGASKLKDHDKWLAWKKAGFPNPEPTDDEP